MDPTLLDSIKNFSIDLYRKVENEQSNNFVFSPLCIQIMLAMIGANNEDTNMLQDFKNSLRLDQIDKSILESFNHLMSSMSIEYWNKYDGAYEQLYMANRILIQNVNESQINHTFIELINSQNHVKCNTIEFCDSSRVAEMTNDWCKKTTDGIIQNIVDSKLFETSSGPNMVVVSGLYLKASWEYPFQKENTKFLPFYIDDHTILEVPTMQSKVRIDYKHLMSLDAILLTIPFNIEDFFMMVIMPNKVKNIHKVEKNLDRIKFDYKREAGTNCLLSLPKFNIKNDMKFGRYLKKLGMFTAFDEKAKFENVSRVKPFFVTDVVQKCFIDICESGTNSTLSAVSRLAREHHYVKPIMEVHINKPFIYMIMHQNTIILLGKIFNPL